MTAAADGDLLAAVRRYQQRRWHPATARFVRQRQHPLAVPARIALAALVCITPALLQRPVRFDGPLPTGASVAAAASVSTSATATASATAHAQAQAQAQAQADGACP